MRRSQAQFLHQNDISIEIQSSLLGAFEKITVKGAQLIRHDFENNHNPGQTATPRYKLPRRGHFFAAQSAKKRRILLGHLLDCLAGFCAVLYAAAPQQLAGLTSLRDLPVNHDCSPAEAVSRIAAYRGGLDQGFAVIRDSDLRVQVLTVFVKNGEPLLTLLLGNLEHRINHKHQLFMYFKMMDANVRSADLYRFRGE